MGDTVVWTNDTSNEAHAVVFLAGQPLPQLPEWFLSNPTGTGISYDGSTFFNSGDLYRPSRPRPQPHPTFTKTGTFPYVDVADFFMEVQGSIIVMRPR